MVDVKTILKKKYNTSTDRGYPTGPIKNRIPIKEAAAQDMARQCETMAKRSKRLV
jgi:hypothetical protein